MIPVQTSIQQMQICSKYWVTFQNADCHRCTQGGQGKGDIKQPPPPGKFSNRNLLTKCNKTKNRGYPGNFVLKALTPPGIFAKIGATPPLDFQCVPLCFLYLIEKLNKVRSVQVRINNVLNKTADCVVIKKLLFQRL